MYFSLLNTRQTGATSLEKWKRINVTYVYISDDDRRTLTHLPLVHSRTQHASIAMNNPQHGRFPFRRQTDLSKY